MRVLFFGDGVWATKTLERLLSEAVDIPAIVIRQSPTDPGLIDLAEDRGIPVLKPSDVNDPDFFKKVKSLAPDLNLSVSYDQIIRCPLIESTPMGFINIHAGGLPFYRGRNVVNWAIINNEKEIGITAHFIDDGIDTGDIILQKKIMVDWIDDYGTVLAKIISEIPEIVLEAIKLAADPSFTPSQQKQIRGTYFGKRGPGDEWLDWNETSLNIYNKIRAITRPGPGAMTLLKGEADPVIIWKARYEKDWPVYRATCGQVVGRDDKGIYVKTGDSTILIQELQLKGGKPEKPICPIGTRFGLNLLEENLLLKQEIKRLLTFMESNEHSYHTQAGY